MKNLIKYLAVLIVAIVISAAVYVKTSSNNNTVKVQNKEALATMHMYVPCSTKSNSTCKWDEGSRHHELTGAVYSD